MASAAPLEHRLNEASKTVIVTAEHRLDAALWQPSEHHDDRPSWALPELIVIHCVSLPEGRFGTGFPSQLFRGTLDLNSDPSFADLDGLRVAPHLLIDRKGEIEQFVAFDKRAWHAGISSWRSRPSCNDFAIGIELEGCVNTDFTTAQYDSLREVVDALLDNYPSLSVEAIVGHNEIAPGRKDDPGPHFSWRGWLAGLGGTASETHD